MDLPSSTSPSLLFALVCFLLRPGGLEAATFTFANKCDFTVWPGILANAASPRLDSTGFELPKGYSRSFLAPSGWSGRFWARTGCVFDKAGSGSCTTGDCGSGQLECNGLGAEPPVTLAEFTLSGTGGQDFYDVSLVDGYNLPMMVEVNGGSGECGSTGCTADLNRRCPVELRVGDGDACKSACEAFRTPEYCCNGAYATPDTCRPSVYSEMFKAACPRSYSYAYDDATSTFTCSGADYTVTFCPSSPSQKSTSYPPPVMTGDTTPPTPPPTGGTTFPLPVTAGGTAPPQPVTGATIPPQDPGSEPGTGMGYSGQPGYSGSGSGMDYTGQPGYSGSGSASRYGSGSGSGGPMLQDGSWLAGLAMGGSAGATSLSFQSALLIVSATVSFIVL